MRTRSGAYNPLTRVPTLVLDDGEVLIESHGILDYLDSLVPAERAMFPRDRARPAPGAEDRGARNRARPTRPSACSTRSGCTARCPTSGSTAAARRSPASLAVLEADRAGRAGDYWFGDRIGHADIAVAAVLRFIAEAHPGLVSMADYPALGAHAARLEALPVFQAISQPFIAAGLSDRQAPARGYATAFGHRLQPTQLVGAAAILIAAAGINLGCCRCGGRRLSRSLGLVLGGRSGRGDERLVEHPASPPAARHGREGRETCPSKPGRCGPRR